MMRICLGLLFCVMVMGCTKPIQLDIPKDHPANPRASAAPVAAHSHYRYHLPPGGELPGKTGSGETTNAFSQTASDQDETVHRDHKPMTPKKAGSGHGH